MVERLQRLKDLIKELESDSYADQYGYADFADTNPDVYTHIDKLSIETSFYKTILNKLNEIL